jgi:predicted  nucleic acid-binding Zn-ribbon protein
MSAIGRIFVIFNLVLAAAFVGWAATSLAKGSEWMQRYQDEQVAHEATRTEMQTQIDELRNNLNTERDQKDRFREERDGAQAERDRLGKDLEEARRANDQLRGDISQIQETLAGYNQTIASLEEAKDAAVAESRDLERQRDAAQDESQQALVAQRDAEDSLDAAQAQIADLERTLTAAREEASHLDALLAQAKALGFEVAVATKPINGRVLQVNYELKPGLVALNVGAEAGVTRGMTFQIYSGSTWKGQVRVENVQPGMSSALILDMKQGETISQGDSAATIL